MREKTGFTMPKRVTDAVEEYQKYKAAGEAASERVRSRNAELAVELAAAEQELDTAIDRAIMEPTPANEQKETEARRKVAELRMTTASGDERASRAFQVGAGRVSELRIEAARIGKEEAEKHFNGNVDQVKQAIADAKYAYLKALTDYRKLEREAGSIWHYGSDGADSTSHVTRQVGGNPHFRGEVVFTNTWGAPLHGIWSDEIDNAYKHGIIHSRSVGKEREILC